MGGAILVAFALTGFERRTARPIQLVAYGWWGVLLVVSVAGAHWQARAAASSQLATYRLVRRISGMPAIDSVLVATHHVPPQEWQGPAPTLRRYAIAMKFPWPPARDFPCPGGESLGLAPTGNIAVVYRSDLCARPGNGAIVERFQRVSFRRFRLVPDSVRIDVVTPFGLR